jgi:hypothetical protein
MASARCPTCGHHAEHAPCHNRFRLQCWPRLAGAERGNSTHYNCSPCTMHTVAVRKSQCCALMPNHRVDEANMDAYASLGAKYCTSQLAAVAVAVAGAAVAASAAAAAVCTAQGLCTCYSTLNPPACYSPTIYRCEGTNRLVAGREPSGACAIIASSGSPSPSPKPPLASPPPATPSPEPSGLQPSPCEPLYSFPRLYSLGQYHSLFQRPCVGLAQPVNSDMSSCTLLFIT